MMMSMDRMVDTQYPGTAVARMLAARDRAKELTPKDVSDLERAAPVIVIVTSATAILVIVTSSKYPRRRLNLKNSEHFP